MTYYDEVNTDSPVIWYRMDGNTLTNHGYWGGSASVGGGVIKVGGGIPGEPNGHSYAFDGNTDAFASQSCGALSQSDLNFSAEAWVATFGGNMSVLGPSTWWFSIASGGQPWSDGIGGGPVNGVTPVNDGNWHHIVFVSTASGRTIYVDGQVDATAPAATSSLSNSDTVNLSSANQYALKGVLAECAYYGGALTADRVLAHYNAGIATTGGGGGTPQTFRGWGMSL